MFIVTGATGNLGRAIAEQLVRRVGADAVGVSVRDPQKAGALRALGVRVRQGDFDDPRTLESAFEGATDLLMVSSNARTTGADPLAQHSAAIRVARAVGVQRIVYTSHMAASKSSAFPPMLDHYATEEMLRRCGLRWTALRNGFFASSAVLLMGDAFQTATIEAPADGKVCWTAHADLAEAAAIILTTNERDDGPTPPLTGSAALDLAEIAHVASDVWARSVQRKVLTHDELRARFAANGMPSRAINTVLGLYIASRNGEFAAVDPTLEQLLGRRPLTMRDVIAAHGRSER